MNEASISPIQTTESLAAAAGTRGDPFYVNLVISDPEVIAAATEYAEGRPRTDFLLTALKIGVLSLRAARGVVDGDSVRREGEHLMNQLGERLNGWRNTFEQNVANSLSHYFDPHQGKFVERVDRLVKADGELASVMRLQVQAAEQSLTNVFTQFIGENSRLLKALDPTGENQLIVTMQRTLDTVVQAQNASIMSQFSLDNKEGALNRFLGELTEKHGDLNQALSKRMDTVIDEFSLDKSDSALSRLVGRVDMAQKAMTSEFSLDNKESAISRLQYLIQTNHEKQMLAVNDVVQRLQATIDTIQARREEAAKGTRHGLEFEAQVCEILHRELDGAGDIVTETGSTTGIISNNKVGDHVITLGPDNAAAGAKIVVECKQKAGVNLDDSLVEAEIARKNRQAAFCVYVHSERTAHSSIPQFQRFGNDIVVRWDAENDSTDLWLKAAVMVAKALSVRAAKRQAGEEASLDAMDIAIQGIVKQISYFDELAGFATTSSNATKKIIDRVALMRTDLEKRVTTLGDELDKLKVRAD